MIEENDRDCLYTFSQPKSIIFVVKHGGKICLAILLFMFLVSLVDNKESGYFNRSVHVIIILGILIYLVGRFLKKFAYKILLDFKSRKIRFYMNRSKDIVTINFDDVQRIRVNGYIIFVFEEGKVLYSGELSNEILTCLNKIVKIDWGFLCALFGPNKCLREKIGKE